MRVESILLSVGVVFGLVSAAVAQSGLTGQPLPTMPWSRGDKPVSIVACEVDVTAGSGLVQATDCPTDAIRGAC